MKSIRKLSQHPPWPMLDPPALPHRRVNCLVSPRLRPSPAWQPRPSLLITAIFWMVKAEPGSVVGATDGYMRKNRFGRIYVDMDRDRSRGGEVGVEIDIVWRLYWLQLTHHKRWHILCNKRHVASMYLYHLCIRFLFIYGPVLRLSTPPWVGGVGGGVGHYQPQGGKGEDLIWGQYTEACKDEDIGMNIQGHYQPEGGRGRSHIGAYVCI